MKILIVILIVKAVAILTGITYFRRVTACRCRHRFFVRGFGKKHFTVTASGEKRRYQWDPQQGTPYCPKCLAEATIECAFCQKLIFARDPVALFPIDPGHIPKHAYVLHRQMVACQRKTCLQGIQESPAGLWLAQGEIEPFPLAEDRPKKALPSQAN